MGEKAILQDIVDHIGEPLFVFSSSGEVLLANRHAAALAGMVYPLSSSMECRHIICGDEEDCDCASAQCLLRAAVSSGGAAHMCRTVGRGERAIMADLIASPVRNSGGAVEKVVVTVREAHRDREGEPGRGDYVKELEENCRIKGLLTEILGHDVLNPAAVIGYCVDALDEGEEDPRRAMLWQMLRKNLSWMIRIIENVSLLSRIERGGQLEFGPVDVASLFGDVVGNLETDWRARNIAVEFRSGNGLRACAHPMIEDAFVNVFSNALRYTPPGGKVEVSVSEAGDCVAVTVRDTGGGIPDEDKERVFAPFERLGRHGGRGQGLGLAIARKIVDLHHGRIWVEDAEGGGAIFRIDLRKWGQG